MSPNGVKTSRKLRLWNGEGRYLLCRAHSFSAVYPKFVQVCARNHSPEVIAYFAAYSWADALRLIYEYLGYVPRGMNREIREYWNEGWGESTKGITPERGIWIRIDKEKPVRVWPEE